MFVSFGSRRYRTRLPFAWTFCFCDARAAIFTKEDGRPPRFLGDLSITMPCSMTPPSGPCQAVAAPTMLPSAQSTTSASGYISFRGSITRPGDSLCTLRSQGRPCTTQHSVPAGCQPLPGRLPACQVPLRDFRYIIRYITFLSSRLCLAHPPRRFWCQTICRDSGLHGTRGSLGITEIFLVAGRGSTDWYSELYDRNDWVAPRLTYGLEDTARTSGGGLSAEAWTVRPLPPQYGQTGPGATVCCGRGRSGH